MKIAVFAYNFPHKKTQDFLFKLFLEGYKPEFVIAANPVKLNLPKSILRVKPQHIDAVHPSVVCEKLNIPYYVLPHNSEEVTDLLRSNEIDIGIIAGARILNRAVIESVRKGIINFHPGLIPEARGLDALKWAINDGLSVGVTAHFINEKVDAGRIILRKELPVKEDDTFIDLALRLEETQVYLLPEVLEMVTYHDVEKFPIEKGEKKANPIMPNELERELSGKLRQYVRRKAKYWSL